MKARIVIMLMTIVSFLSLPCKAQTAKTLEPKLENIA